MIIIIIITTIIIIIIMIMTMTITITITIKLIIIIIIIITIITIIIINNIKILHRIRLLWLRQVVQYVLVHSSWYGEHLKECDGGSDDNLRIRVVLLTNDRANKEKAKKEGIISYTG